MNQMVEWQQHRGPAVAAANGVDIIECETCGFKHAIPIPTPVELAATYSGQPFVSVPDDREGEWLQNVYRDRYETLEELLPAERRRLLDIGSGAGTFLLCGQERNWQVRGIEPCAELAAYSRQQGLDVMTGFFDSVTVAELVLADAVAINEVLEHIPAPIEFLQLATSLLQAGGILTVTVANEFNPLQTAYRQIREVPPWWLVPPVHVNYFDTRSLPQLLGRLGYDVLHVEATFPIDMFLLMGEEYLGNLALGGQCHERRRTFELNMRAGGQNSVKRALYRKMAEIGLGREVTVYARKY
ncbi:MAG TPA: class I SAM-dependent methyltransferase [Patescibacteria group bacterium]|nr:class I SAM-dependent methyltransferase [Patescibacteria group bacterium]